MHPPSFEKDPCRSPASVCVWYPVNWNAHIPPCALLLKALAWPPLAPVAQHQRVWISCLASQAAIMMPCEGWGLTATVVARQVRPKNNSKRLGAKVLRDSQQLGANVSSNPEKGASGKGLFKGAKLGAKL
jgi:hypothetical protein